MTGKQRGQKKKHSDVQKQEEGNLGQQEARLEKEKESELPKMGEMSRESDSDRKDKQHTD
jgi:hypothetical protein